MSYNRWTESDYLAHHGVKGQVWGHKNGPPYPLSRQDKFRTVGPDGRPITSKVAYKKAQKNVRAANRVERKANPNGTPQDKEERNSFGAQIKRKYRQFKREEKARQEEEKKQSSEAQSKWNEAVNRLRNSGMSKEEADKLFDSINRINGGLSAGERARRLEQAASKLNEALNNFEERRDAEAKAQKAARDAAKEHGTAEEVMKYRDTFNKDEWNEIAGRLEAEARVKKLLDRPLDSANSNQNQGKNQSQGQPQEKTSSSGLSGKLKKIAEKGDAREVYQNRAKFTPEQLQTISRRLQAEETIANFADNQLLFKSDTLRNLENVARYAQTAGKIATGISTITKAFGGSGGGGNNNQSNNGGGGNNQQNSGKKKDENNKLNERLTRLEESMRSKGLRYTGGNIIANAHLVERLNAQKSNKKEKQKK